MRARRSRVRLFGLLSRAVVPAAACACWLAAPSRAPSAPPPTEYQVKAAFLLNFTKFVEWPSNAFADSDSPLAICILGKDPFGRALDEIVQGEAVNGRRLVVRRISEPPAPRACQVLFLDTALPDPAKTLGGLGSGVLTVGDRDDFLRDGGMIGFVIENRRVRFDIDQAAAGAAGLKLSSKLLSVARTVAKGRG